jgi:hypothetical protein
MRVFSEVIFEILEIAIATVVVGLSFSTAEAQAVIGSTLNVEIENSTLYRIGFCTLAEQKPTKLPAQSSVISFGRSIGAGDIVSVNGQAVKGVAVVVFNGGIMSTTPAPGQVIADINLNPMTIVWELTFVNLDGTRIGAVDISGSSGQYTVTGGTGPFFGTRGTWSAAQDPVSGERTTSDCEDPSYRRINADPGGNKRHGVLYLVPATPPQIVTTPNGPAITHSTDFSLVTASKPAAAGEILSLFATGLGPVRGVATGQPFPSNLPAPVNSPVQVMVNGNPAEVLGAVGYPGSVDGYQVNFRVPSDVPKGSTSIQVAAAWISSAPAGIAVQ